MRTKIFSLIIALLLPVLVYAQGSDPCTQNGDNVTCSAPNTATSAFRINVPHASGTYEVLTGGSVRETITGAGVKTSNQDANFATGKTLGIQEATSASACSGTLTANGATPVVTSTTCAATGSRIFLTRTSAETGVVTAWISAISNGVSFSVTGEAGDTGTYNWVIFHEAP